MRELLPNGGNSMRDELQALSGRVDQIYLILIDTPKNRRDNWLSSFYRSPYRQGAEIPTPDGSKKMSMTLQIQVAIYMIIIAFSTGVIAYSQGFRDGKSKGYQIGRNISRHTFLQDMDANNG